MMIPAELQLKPGGKSMAVQESKVSLAATEYEKEVPNAPEAVVGLVRDGATVSISTLLLAADAELVPAALVAVTVNVYEVPFAKPVTVIGLNDPVPVRPLGFDVTV